LISIAVLKHKAGDYSTAQVHLTVAQMLSTLSGNMYDEAQALWIGAVCSTCLGDFRQSMIQLYRGREILVNCGLAGGTIDLNIIMHQGEMHFMKSEYAQARSIYSKVVGMSSPDKNVFSYALSLLNIANIDITIGGPREEVYQNLKKARDVFSSNNYMGSSLSCSMVEATLKLREKEFDLALVQFQECLHLAWGIDNEVELLCLEKLADIKTWRGIGLPYTWPVIYLGHAQKCKDKLALHKALLFLGDVFIANKDKETATNLYTVVLEGFTHMDVRCSQAQCKLRLGDLTKERGHILEAIAFWRAAQPQFAQSLQVKDVAQIDSRLLTLKKTHQNALLEITTLDAPVYLLNASTEQIPGSEMMRATEARRVPMNKPGV
jgi:tetratricopeptide (TPR) repeat protein